MRQVDGQRVERNMMTIPVKNSWACMMVFGIRRARGPKPQTTWALFCSFSELHVTPTILLPIYTITHACEMVFNERFCYYMESCIAKLPLIENNHMISCTINSP
ncbi:hypothetical protein YC2023_096403 [Brassica napus]